MTLPRVSLHLKTSPHGVHEGPAPLASRWDRAEASPASEPTEASVGPPFGSAGSVTTAPAQACSLAPQSTAPQTPCMQIFTTEALSWKTPAETSCFRGEDSAARRGYTTCPRACCSQGRSKVETRSAHPQGPCPPPALRGRLPHPAHRKCCHGKTQGCSCREMLGGSEEIYQSICVPVDMEVALNRGFKPPP